MVWIAIAIFFGCCALASGICQAAKHLSNTKVKVVFGKTEYIIETSRNRDEKKGYIWTRVH